MPASLLDARPGLDDYFDREVILGIRPVGLRGREPGRRRLAADVGRADVTEALGSEIHVIFSIDAPPVKHAALGDTAAADADDEDAAVVIAGGKSLWTARVAARSTIRPGQPVELAVDTSNLQFFDPVSALSIGHPAATEVVAAGEAANA